MSATKSAGEIFDRGGPELESCCAARTSDVFLIDNGIGKTAETAGTYLHKGQLLYIEGQLRNSSWDDAATGQKRYRTEVVVAEFKFLGPKQQSQEAAA